MAQVPSSGKKTTAPYGERLNNQAGSSKNKIGFAYKYVDPDGKEAAPATHSVGEIRSMYGNKDGPGHHDSLTRAQAIKYREVITPEAIEHASRTKIGGDFINQKLPGDPHNGWSGPHRLQDAKIEENFLKQGYTKENPMTVKDFYKWREGLGKIPEVAEFRRSIVSWERGQLEKGERPNLNRVVRRVGGASRGASE